MTPPRRTILVTGATSGIGRQAALHLAQRGHMVFATGRNRSALDALRKEGQGLSLHTLPLDVCSQESIDEALGEIATLTGERGLDVVINNAGYGQVGPVELIDDELARAQFETNVFGVLRVTRSVLPGMRERGHGRIINVTSIGGRVTLPLMGIYNASKYAVESLSDALRNEVKAFGIDVVLIEPGTVRTHFADTGMAMVSPFRGRAGVYEVLLERADGIVKKFDATAVSPMVIARTIARAVETRRPWARYVTPRLHGALIAFSILLPTAWMDWLMRRAMGLDALLLEGLKATLRSGGDRAVGPR